MGPDEKGLAKSLSPSRMRRGARWSQEKASLSIEEAAISCLIVCDPLFNLFPAELAWRGQFFVSAAQSCSEKEDKFPLLLHRQSISGGFDLSERAHDWERSITAARISRACFVPVGHSSPMSITQRDWELTAEATEVSAELAEESPNSTFLCEVLCGLCV